MGARRVGLRLPYAVLAFAAGVLDVAAVLRLGTVFASVMTSNLVFIGVAAVRHQPTLGAHCAVALAGYILGVALGSAVVAPSASGESRLGTFRLTVLLAGEAILLAVFAAGWIATGSRPQSGTQYVLLAVVTIAVGAQSAATRAL